MIIKMRDDKITVRYKPEELDKPLEPTTMDQLKKDLHSAITRGGHVLMGTLSRELWPIALHGESIKTDHCVVCGERGPLNDHHIIPRSEGSLSLDGQLCQKPTITLCGYGNALSSAGTLSYGRVRPYCHGLAHHHLLHFRINEEELAAGNGCVYEVLRTEWPTPYSEALKMDGWAPLAFLDGSGLELY